LPSEGAEQAEGYGGLATTGPRRRQHQSERQIRARDKVCRESRQADPD
jgi:hypothetical protein